MNFNLNEIIKLDTKKNELDNVYKELLKSEKLLKERAKELTVIRIIDYLKTQPAKLQIDILINNKITPPYFEVEVYDDDEIDMLISDNVNDLISLPDLFILDIISYLSKTAQYSEISFKNNPKGRDKLIKFIIGGNWKEWKKENETLISYDNLNQNLPIKSEVNKVKRKL